MNALQAWAKLRPFCPSIANLIEEPSISEIEVNPDGSVFVEALGFTERIHGLKMPEDERETICQQIARSLGKDISDRDPLLDARLPDGSRVAAIAPPISRNWTFTIRKFSERRWTLEDLVGMETITSQQCRTLEMAVEERKTILVSGGTSAGKTSLLNALAAALPPEDRIVLIEDTAEIRIDSPNAVKLEARSEQAGVNAVTVRDLVKQSLRLRPDRIIVGEVRGAEAFDLLQALNSGHAGSMSTIHANSAEAAPHKLALYCQTASLDIPMRALGPSIAEAINIVVQMNRRNGRRIVDQIVNIRGYDPNRDSYSFE